MQKIDIAHLTSVHSRYDTRIFLKECRSLVAAGFRVALVVADSKGDEEIDGVQIYDVGYSTGRLRRIAITSRRLRSRALKLDADVYHLHDPELLAISGALRRAGKKVIFDAHEDVPVQILGKPYLHPWIRQLLSKMYEKYAAHACQRLAGIVAATPYIEDKFLRVNSNSVNISNFPLPDEFVSPGAVQVKDRKQVCYLGGIGVSRGIREMIRALEMLESNTRLVLCGRFEDERVRRELETHAGWVLVDDRGWLDRDAIRDVLLESAAGLVTLQPQQNYLDAYPIKMFEYMSAAVPVISSDFPLWREIVEGNDCGICVDPVQPQAIAEAIDYLVQNPLRAREMGENGRRAIENKYNWTAEESKLVEFYEQLFHGARK